MAEFHIFNAPQDLIAADGFARKLRAAGAKVELGGIRMASPTAHAIVIWSAAGAPPLMGLLGAFVGLWAEGRLSFVAVDQTPLPLGLRDAPIQQIVGPFGGENIAREYARQGGPPNGRGVPRARAPDDASPGESANDSAASPQDDPWETSEVNPPKSGGVGGLVLGGAVALVAAGAGALFLFTPLFPTGRLGPEGETRPPVSTGTTTQVEIPPSSPSAVPAAPSDEEIRTLTSGVQAAEAKAREAEAKAQAAAASAKAAALEGQKRTEALAAAREKQGRAEATRSAALDEIVDSARRRPEVLSEIPEAVARELPDDVQTQRREQNERIQRDINAQRSEAVRTATAPEPAPSPPPGDVQRQQDDRRLDAPAAARPGAARRRSEAARIRASIPPEQLTAVRSAAQRAEAAGREAEAARQEVAALTAQGAPTAEPEEAAKAEADAKTARAASEKAVAGIIAVARSHPEVIVRLPEDIRIRLPREVAEMPVDVPPPPTPPRPVETPGSGAAAPGSVDTPSAGTNSSKGGGIVLEDRLQALPIPLWLSSALGVLLLGGALVVLLWKKRRRGDVRSQSDADATSVVQKPDASSVAPVTSKTLFVSYSHRDRALVEPLVDRIQAMGHPVWMDKEGLTGGPAWGAQIVRAIKGSRAVVLMASRQSYGSDHVVREMYLAMNHKKPIVPIEIELAELPEELEYILAQFQRHDVTEDSEEALQRALSGLPLV
jgi:hypothetical protein